MGEDCHCADQTRYVCGNSIDDPVLDIWGVADSLVPQEKSTVKFNENDPIYWRETPLHSELVSKGQRDQQCERIKGKADSLVAMALKMPGQVYLAAVFRSILLSNAIWPA